MRLQPLSATLAAFAAMLAIAIAGHLLVWHTRVWFAWLIPVLQIFLALLCSVATTHSSFTSRNGCSKSLSPLICPPNSSSGLLDEPALRKPGGSQQEVSMLFTDLENFSRIQRDDAPR